MFVFHDYLKRYKSYNKFSLKVLADLLGSKPSTVQSWLLTHATPNNLSVYTKLINLIAQSGIWDEPTTSKIIEKLRKEKELLEKSNKKSFYG